MSNIARTTRLAHDDAMDAYALADRDRPWVRLNFVTSIDGAAARDGVSGGLGTDDDRVVFEALRTMTDVVLVAAGTIRAEGYGGMRVDDRAVGWREHRGISAQPTLAIVSRSVDLDPQHPVFVEAVVRPIVVTCAAASIPRGLDAVADVVVCGDESVDLAAALVQLASRGLRQVLCEGGPGLAGSLLEADLVDELCLTLSPVLEGGSAIRMIRGEHPSSRAMRLEHAIPSGDTVLLRYVRAGR